MHETEVWALEAIKLFSNKNLDYLLDLFEEDAMLYEPFSREGMLRGLGEIAPFLKVICNYPGFLFSKESTRITTVKYASLKVRVETDKPPRYRLHFEFGKQNVGIKGKKLRKIKKLRIDT